MTQTHNNNKNRNHYTMIPMPAINQIQMITTILIINNIIKDTLEKRKAEEIATAK